MTQLLNYLHVSIARRFIDPCLMHASKVNQLYDVHLVDVHYMFSVNHNVHHTLSGHGQSNAE